MFAASTDFTNAAKAIVRDPRARVEITWVDPYIDSTIQVTSNDSNRISWLNQVFNKRENVPYKWAHLDETIKANGEFYPAPSTEQEAELYEVGWWSASAGDAEGSFSLPYPELTITFTAQPILQIYIVGDNAYNEYPVDFVVSIYNGVSLVRTLNVIGNSDLKFSTDISDFNVTSATKMVLTVTKWSAPNAVVKITEFYSSILKVYKDSDIKSISLLEESDLSEGSLPIGNISSNEIDLSLQNIDDQLNPANTSSLYHTLLKPKRKVRAWIGFRLPVNTLDVTSGNYLVELDDKGDKVGYLPIGTFYTGDWSTPEQGTAVSTAARDVLESLRKNEFSSSLVYEYKTLYELAEIILLDAKKAIIDLQYNILVDLQNVTVPYAYFEKKSYFNILKEIVAIGLTRCYVDRLGVLRVGVNIDQATDYSITKSDYFTKEQPQKYEEISNYIEVNVRPLVPASAELYKADKPISVTAGTQTISCKYSKSPALSSNPTISITGVNQKVVTLSSVYIGDNITVNGQTFTCAFGDSLADDQFLQGINDTETAKNLSSKISSVENVGAEAIGNTVEITGKTDNSITVSGTINKFTIVTTSSSGSASFVSAFYYAFSADVKILATVDCKVRITINGTQIVPTGETTIVKSDSGSIKEFGILKYTLKNNLIQSQELATTIAQTLLNTYKNNRKDANITWCGNPQIELCDVCEIPEYQKNNLNIIGQFYVTKQKLEFDGTLKASLDGRKI